MKRLGSLSWFVSALALGAVLVVGEVAMIWIRHAAVVRAEAQLERKRGELRELAAREPAPTPEMADALAADLRRVRQALATLRAEVRGRGALVERLRQAPVPQGRTEAFFELVDFVKTMRERAGQAGLVLKPEEHFGFADYANAGPEPESIAAVFRQRQIVQCLVEALGAAGAERLVAVQREWPVAQRAARTGGMEAMTTAGTQRASRDTFTLDPRSSVRVPGLVETSAFRLCFIGRTAVLRQWLEHVAASELPLVVRTIDVERAGRAEGGERRSVEGAGAPLIAGAPSQFTVTVEFVEWVETSGPEAGAP